MGVEKGFIMTQGAIDPKNTGRWSHPIYTERWLDRVVPADFDGFITLNWEGKAIGVLHDGPSHPEFEQTVDEWVRLIRFVREQRPRAYVGMYSLPIRQYWGQDEEWRRAALAYKPILDASSVIYPSVYDFYHRNPAGDHERFGNIVELALELAEGKPVILYTRHRYHPSNKVFPNRIIPRDEYVNHVRHLMNVEVDGQRPAGVVAWSNDMALLRAPREHEPGEKPNPALELLQKEMRPGESRIEYLERVMRRVFCLLNEAVRDMPCESIPPGSKPSVHGDGPVTGSRGG
jgi:hypothetical protein